MLGVGNRATLTIFQPPHPQGEGAIRAINQALTDAQLTPDDVGYINLHRHRHTASTTRLNQWWLTPCFGRTRTVQLHPNI
ncbi:hypothetical protein [Escherichia coli]|uniref:hypothetical protein n=1 Tax=Escherichia coli TaxID=562 RepID=UPI003CCC7EF1